LLRGVQCTLRGLAGVAAQDAAEEPLSRQPCERQVECRDVGLLLRREIEPTASFFTSAGDRHGARCQES